MSTSKLISIVGHSLVPQNIGTIEGATIDVYRSPGSKVSFFETNPILSSVLNQPHDLTILFIGGNDVHDNCVPLNIANNIQHTVELIHERCRSHIALVLIEYRNPRAGNRFNVTASKYRRIANNINNRLKRKFKSTPYVQFLSVGAKPFQYGVRGDGVHFDEEAKAHLTLKFRNCIKYFLNKA